MDIIYLDGTRLDREQGAAGVQLVYQSPLLTDIDSITSNRTNTVTFPLTDGNRRAIGFAGTRFNASLFAYRWHRAILVRDGVQMFDGYGTLLNVKESTFDMAFVWGNVSYFAALKDVSIRDLQQNQASDYCLLPPHNDHRNSVIDWGASRFRPVMTADEVLARIESRFGVSGLTGPSHTGRFAHYVLPLTNNNGDNNTHLAQGFAAYDGDTAAYEFGVMHYVYIKPENTGRFIDLNGIMNDGGMIDVSDADSVLFRLIGRLKIAVTISESALPASLPWAVFKVVGVANGAEISTPLYSQEYGAPVWNAEENAWIFTLANEASQTISTANVDSVYISIIDRTQDVTIQSVAFYLEEGTADAWANIYLCKDPTASEDAQYIQGVQPEYFPALTKQYPLFLNLPDWKCTELLKQLMLLEGVFAMADSPTHVTFVSVADVISRRQNAADWTGLLLTLNPAETLTTLNTAQRNNCVYAGDDNSADGYFATDDETLDAEKTYAKSSFAASAGNAVRMYTVEGESVKANKITQRVLYNPTAGGYAAAVFDGRLEWSTLLTRPDYAALKSILLHPEVVKAKIRCDVVTLANLDLVTPVYLKQTGRYYAVRTLTAGDTTADVELICIDNINPVNQ